GLVFSLSSLLLTSLASMKPDHKLPSLLVKETLIHSLIAAIGVIGFLIMRLMGAGSLLHGVLWCIILLSVEWLVWTQKNTKGPPSQSLRQSRMRSSQRPYVKL